jgi:hypothetical protein
MMSKEELVEALKRPTIYSSIIKMLFLEMKLWLVYLTCVVRSYSHVILLQQDEHDGAELRKVHWYSSALHPNLDDPAVHW